MWLFCTAYLQFLTLSPGMPATGGHSGHKAVCMYLGPDLEDAPASKWILNNVQAA